MGWAEDTSYDPRSVYRDKANSRAFSGLFNISLGFLQMHSSLCVIGVTIFTLHASLRPSCRPELRLYQYQVFPVQIQRFDLIRFRFFIHKLLLCFFVTILTPNSCVSRESPVLLPARRLSARYCAWLAHSCSKALDHFLSSSIVENQCISFNCRKPMYRLGRRNSILSFLCVNFIIVFQI